MIKKGDRFKCIKTVIMNIDPYNTVYYEGKFYVSDCDGCITDEDEDTHHSWPEHELSKYFVKVDNIKKENKVEHPSHYTWLKDKCGIEVIDITRHLDFDKGNAVKYILRSGYKEEQGYTTKQKEIEDIKKAIWYLNDKLKMLENGISKD